jgi:hypothetical protein
MDSADDARRARRAFIRAYHPDRGGNTQYFIAGLERLSRQLEPIAEDPIRVFIRPALSWRGRLIAVGRRVVRRRVGPPRVH